MRRGLGITPTPYGKLPNGAPPYTILFQYGGAYPQLCPEDPQHYNQDDAGYYYDTHLGAPKLGIWHRLKAKLSGLGAIPTDFELAKVRGYLPVESGWIRTTTGYQTGPWTPPSGAVPGIVPKFQAPMAALSGLRGRKRGLFGLGLPDSVPATGDAPATVEDVMATMAAHNDRVFALALVSTSAVAVSALLGLFRTLKLIRAGE